MRSTGKSWGVIVLVLTGVAAIGVLAALADTVPGLTVHASTAPMVNAASSQTPTTVGCPSGSTLVGGGFRDNVAADGSQNTMVPNNGLTMHGTYPSDPGGNASGSGASTPGNWTAMGGFAGQAEAGDVVTAFAICATGGPSHTTVVTATVAGPQAAATTAAATATCPSGSSLVGGGGQTNNGTTQPSFKVVGSFPSDASGAASVNGASSPGSWTAVGSAGGVGSPSNTTTAFAVCSTDVTVATTVVRADRLDTPEAPTTFTTVTATCPSGTALLGGGAEADGSGTGADGGTPQQGVHVRGSYPSAADGGALADGASSPGSWTAIVQSGGQSTPGTDSHAWALCAQPASSGGGGASSGGSSTPVSPTPVVTTTIAAPASPALPSAAALSPPTRTAKVLTGKGGSLAAGAGAQAVTMRWTASGLGRVATLSASPISPKVPGSHGTAAATVAVNVVATSSGGTAVKSFAHPLELVFGGAPGNVIPAWSANGLAWTAVPRILAGPLPVGLEDGWYRDSSGAVHLLTSHATDFGLLASVAGLVPTREPAALGYVAPAKVRFGRRLVIRVTATRPGTLAIALAGRSWHRKLSGAEVLSLALPPRVHKGTYRISLTLTAAGARVTHSASVELVAPAT
jgi:hypothetical protein